MIVGLNVHKKQILGNCWVGGGNVSNLEQSYINYKNFHKIYINQIFQLTNKKRLDWYNKFLITWYFKKKEFYRAYVMQKKIKPNDLRSYFKSIIIKFLFFIETLKKNDKKNN